MKTGTKQIRLREDSQLTSKRLIGRTILPNPAKSGLKIKSIFAIAPHLPTTQPSAFHSRVRSRHRKRHKINSSRAWSWLVVDRGETRPEIQHSLKFRQVPLHTIGTSFYFPFVTS
jgi:hypothetical protein